MPLVYPMIKDFTKSNYGQSMSHSSSDLLIIKLFTKSDWLLQEN
jgi:hypothetical protein